MDGKKNRAKNNAGKPGGKAGADPEIDANFNSDAKKKPEPMSMSDEAAGTEAQAGPSKDKGAESLQRGAESLRRGAQGERFPAEVRAAGARYVPNTGTQAYKRGSYLRRSAGNESSTNGAYYRAPYDLRWAPRLNSQRAGYQYWNGQRWGNQYWSGQRFADQYWNGQRWGGQYWTDLLREDQYLGGQRWGGQRGDYGSGGLTNNHQWEHQRTVQMSWFPNASRTIRHVFNWKCHYCGNACTKTLVVYYDQAAQPPDPSVMCRSCIMARWFQGLR